MEHPIKRRALLSLSDMSESEVFQMRCPVCNSKLNAKVRSIGQTRPCPKCKAPIVIQQSVIQQDIIPQRFDLDMPTSDASVSDSLPVTSANEMSVKPPQLEFRDRYFILGQDKVIAYWEGSKGWQVNVGSGFAPARSNTAAIPDQGVFAFVEMIMESGIPKKLQSHKISSRGALTVLFRDAHAILGKLEEPIDLTPFQKDALLRHLRLMFMSAVLDAADDVIAYLMSS